MLLKEIKIKNVQGRGMKQYHMSSETVKAADAASCLKIENLQEIKTAQRGQMGMRAEEKQQSIKSGEKQPGFQLH